MLDSLLKKVAGLQTATLLKKGLQNRCFPVIFAFTIFFVVSQSDIKKLYLTFLLVEIKKVWERMASTQLNSSGLEITPWKKI